MSDASGPTTLARGEKDLTEPELFSIAYADADGWRCFYPLTRGHLTAAQARAQMRKERGQAAETQQEADAAESLLAFGNLCDMRDAPDRP